MVPTGLVDTAIGIYLNFGGFLIIYYGQDATVGFLGLTISAIGVFMVFRGNRKESDERAANRERIRRQVAARVGGGAVEPTEYSTDRP